MSTATPPDVDSSACSSTDVSPVLEDGLLRFELLGTAPRLTAELHPLLGSCPAEGSFYFSAEDYPDMRKYSPLTLRFSMKDVKNLFKGSRAQNLYRASLWSTISEVTTDCTPADLPRVIFLEFEKQDDEALGISAFDLTFPSTKIFKNLRRLKELSIGVSGEERRVFKRSCLTNQLPSDHFVIDCLNLHLGQNDQQELHLALRCVTASLGCLVGIAKVVVKEKGWEGSPFASSTGILRAYVKLDRRWMSGSIDDIALRLPSHLVWYGNPHKLLYINCHLHTKPNPSKDYPRSLAEEAATSQVASAAKQSSAGAVAPNASKKRKERDE